MTSSNETGQGIGSTTTEVGEDRDPSSYRDDSPGAEPSDGVDDTAEPEATASVGAADAQKPDGDTSRNDKTARPEPAAGETVSEKATETSKRAASSATTKDDDAKDGVPGTAASEDDVAKEKPIPGGIWRSAYEAGAAAPSSRYVVSGPSQEESAPTAAPTLGSAVAKASKPQVSPEVDESEIDDSTHPRNVPGQTPPPPKPPSDAWQRVPAAEADAAPTIPQLGASNESAPDAAGDSGRSDLAQAAGAAAVGGVAAGTAAAGSAVGDSAANVKQGAVKAAQAALAAARNAAKKVSSAMPESAGGAKDSAQAPATPPPAPPEMHYAAGAVRGTASVPQEETVPVAPGTTSSNTPDGDTVRAPELNPTPRTPGGPRRVRLAISRIDPWSVMKLAFLLSVAVAIMTVVATAVFWSVIDSLGVFAAVEQFVTEAIGSDTEVDVMQYVEFERVVSLATLVAICNVVLMTALATILTFLYNITSALVGGVHMTLTDD